MILPPTSMSLVAELLTCRHRATRFEQTLTNDVMLCNNRLKKLRFYSKISNAKT